MLTLDSGDRMKNTLKPVFFPKPADFRAWLEKHHATATELLVGFYKVDSGKPSITWPESVDQALCFGWIDGVRRRVDEMSYTIRFTPRKSTSIWSEVNIKKYGELVAQGQVFPAGQKAWERRLEAKSGIYAYEQRHTAELEKPFEEKFRANRKAWDYFQTLPPGYRRVVTWWIVSAKRQETRESRLAILIKASAAGKRIDLLSPRKKS